ncbi:MAG: hypothetical protein V3R81_10400 [Gammaproteobacteria bacterium]
MVQPTATARAIAFMLLGVFAGIGLDTAGKWLLQTYPLAQFVFLRSVFGAIALTACAA